MQQKKPNSRFGFAEYYVWGYFFSIGENLSGKLLYPSVKEIHLFFRMKPMLSISSYYRFLEGDENALYDIVKQYRDGLLFFVNGYIRNISEAEEIVEDTFSELIFKKGHFKGESELKTYLYRIGHNKAINYLKKRSRYSDVSIDDMEEQICDEVMLEKTFLINERNKALYDAMSNLPPDYNIALQLVCLHNMSYGEAASIMRKSNKQINNLVYRAKIALKTILIKEGFVYEEL